MTEYVGLIMSALIGFLTSVVLTWKFKEGVFARISRDALVAFFVTLIFSIPIYFSHEQSINQEKTISDLKNEKNHLNGKIEGLTNGLLIAAKDVQVDVFNKSFSMIPRRINEENFNRGIPTEDNAFYIDFSNGMAPIDQGAMFWIAATKVDEHSDREVAQSCTLPVYRTGISELPYGNYIYKFSIPEPIASNSNTISLKVTKELNIERLMKLSGATGVSNAKSEEEWVWKKICKTNSNG